MWQVFHKSASLTFVAMTGALFLLMPSWSPSQLTLSEDSRLPLDCRSFAELTDLKLVDLGRTKVVYEAKFRGRSIALKMINVEGLDMESCISAFSLHRCFTVMSAKFLRELIILQYLDHPNVVKVLGSCIPSSRGPILVATELGSPLEFVALQRLRWEEKLKILVAVGSLLHLLANSPLGSLALTDLKSRQFVVVDGEVKLSDLDGIKSIEPTCKQNSECLLFSGTGSSYVLCESGYCRGHNEQSNILLAGKDLISYILVDTGPKELQPMIRNILSAYKGELGWNTTRILKKTQDLVELSG